MKKRETSMEIEIEGRKFIINKVDPVTGCYIATTIASKVLPAGLSSFIGVSIENKEKMNKDEFREFQRDICECVFEVLDAGPVNILDKNGNPAIIDLTAPLLMRLTGESIKFNFSDFFDVSLWKGFLPEAQLSIFTKLLTSTNFFSHLFQQGFGNNTSSGTEHTPSAT